MHLLHKSKRVSYFHKKNNFHYSINALLPKTCNKALHSKILSTIYQTNTKLSIK